MIKTTAEIQQYVSVDINFQQKSLLPYIEQSKTQIIRLLGKEQYNELENWYNLAEGETQPGNAAELEVLLPYVQRPIANFAIFYGLSALNVVVGPTGIGVVNTQNLAPASKDRTDTLRNDLIAAAYDAMESLLVFLEENKEDYPLWENSEAYSEQYDVLITSARRFDEIYRIDRSRLKYLEWRPVMRDVELLEMAPLVSSDLMDEIKGELKDNAVSNENQIVLPYLQKALAYITASRANKDEKLYTDGMRFLMAAKAILDTNVDSYPAYRDSGVWKSPEKAYKRYENTEESKFFVIG
ncbi:MAG: hypothetical protein EOL88_06125 [Bacteroidia bacterium]|nr:hypothetical protein [Bacteroidia bacterium]